MTDEPRAHAGDDWQQQFFDDDYGRWGLAPLTDEAATRYVTFLRDVLRLEDGQTIFDQCCGVGRLSLPLAGSGLRVVGVDVMPHYVEQAQAAASKRELPCTFHCADAHDFVAPGPCDAAVNWFTSFGYSRDDAVNRRLMQRAFESLRPGGRFIIDFQNLPRIFAEFQPCIVERPQVEGMQGLLVMQESVADLAGGMMHSTWTIIHGDGTRRERQVSVRIYLPHQLLEMMASCGFTEIELMGSADAEPLELKSRRCLVLGRRPG